MSLFEKILLSRNITPENRANFLAPDYLRQHDPFLLPDMQTAVERLVVARRKQETVTIYGDYDIDGLTATTVLMDSLKAFGFNDVRAFIPNRFVEGYGLTDEAIEKIAKDGANLIITVDCGSLSHGPIEKANQLGVDVIVTDHHSVAEVQPPAVAVINPKRPDHTYPFIDLAGVGVAFKLVQALRTKLKGLDDGQEKWLLDLVALGTVCDVVSLQDENRLFVYYGLKVLAKTRRPGLKALMLVSGVEPEKVNARSLGFALGPRMNAAGRLETAQHALDMLLTTDKSVALSKAQLLDDLNRARRKEQDRIYQEAVIQAKKYDSDDVLVVSGSTWNHGIVGIVAAKLLEKFKKPTFVLEEMGDESKGSARSFGDFSAVEAIRVSDDLISKGGGHKLAAGVTLPTKNIDAFRKRVNQFYKAKKLANQARLLLPVADTDALIDELSEPLVTEISQLEPFGNGNPQPVFRSAKVVVQDIRYMGTEGQHIKLTVHQQNTTFQLISFNAAEEFKVEQGAKITAWYSIAINEWQGRRSVEGQLLHLEVD